MTANARPTLLFSGMCKHCVATLLELIHQNEPEYSPKRLSDFLPFSDGKTSAPKSQNRISTLF